MSFLFLHPNWTKCHGSGAPSGQLVVASMVLLNSIYNHYSVDTMVGHPHQWLAHLFDLHRPSGVNAIGERGCQVISVDLTSGGSNCFVFKANDYGPMAGRGRLPLSNLNNVTVTIIRLCPPLSWREARDPQFPIKKTRLEGRVNLLFEFAG